MKKGKLLILCCIFELTIIILIAIANVFDGLIYCIFYNLLYGLVVSTILPLLFLLREKSDLRTIGFKRPGKYQLFVLFLFVSLSIAGQTIPKLMAGERLNFQVLPIAILPLIMTTFFEEFLFRGFFQTKLETSLGRIPAIIVSGLLFSLYHLGYPGFRTASDILLLFAVGIGFALSFSLSGGNMIVSYFVNLPNAFVTYILKHEQFPIMTTECTIYAGITTMLTVTVLFLFEKTDISLFHILKPR